MEEGMYVGILVPLGVFAMVVLIVWIAHLAKKNRVREQAELQKRFLDKFGSAQELTQFLETPQGQRFMADLSLGDKAAGPKHRLINTIKSGIVLIALGVAFFALMRLEYDLIYPAVILSALGIGFLISAVISYQLSKRWRIFEESEITLEKRAGLK